MRTRLLVMLFAVPLLFLAGCSREKSDWRSAQAADTAESYEQFIGKHPDSARVAAARERLGQLAEERDWRKAAAQDSLEAYQQFLAQYPGGRWAREAQIRIENFAATPPAPGAATAQVSPDAAGAGANVPTAPDTTPASGTAGSGYGVQLGAFSSAERANAEWKKLKAEAAGTLDGLEPRVVVGDASGKTIYRLQAEVRDEAQARAICGGLKVVHHACVPVLPAHAP
jgi:cell division septation protein DedD